ncbi:MAG: phospholipase D-like domain-containing protein [Comamonas sp.]
MLQVTLLSGLGHTIAVVVALLVYSLVTRAGHQRRHPASAIGWVLGMLTFPYLFLPLFLAFGPRKAVRPPAHRAPLLGAQLRAVVPPPVPLWAGQLLASMELDAAQPNAQVRFHADGLQALQELLALIGRAKRSIDISTYVFGHDVVGRQIASALQQAAQRGVKVRLLLDGVGCWRLLPAHIRPMRKAGVLVRRFMVPLMQPTRGGSNLRNHRKVAVADGVHLWSGGRNLADEYFLPSNQGHAPWVDLSFTLQGALAGIVAGQFEADWRAARGRRRPMWLSPALPLGGGNQAWAQWVPSGPDHADDSLHALYLASAFHAQNSITLVSPYFVPDEALLEAWCLACRRGVRLRIVLPQQSNHRLADWARERALRSLALAGAEIYCSPTMLHAKLVVVDERMALCGSANLDGRSLFLNYEAMTAFYSSPEISWLAQWCESQIAASQRYTYRQPGWWRDLGEGLVRAVAFQL